MSHLRQKEKELEIEKENGSNLHAGRVSSYSLTLPLYCSAVIFLMDKLQCPHTYEAPRVAH